MKCSWFQLHFIFFFYTFFFKKLKPSISKFPPWFSRLHMLSCFAVSLSLFSFVYFFLFLYVFEMFLLPVAQRKIFPPSNSSRQKHKANQSTNLFLFVNRQTAPVGTPNVQTVLENFPVGREIFCLGNSPWPALSGAEDYGWCHYG